MPPNGTLLAAPREIIEIPSDSESESDVMEIPRPPQPNAVDLASGLDGPPPLANADFDQDWEAIIAAVEDGDARAAAFQDAVQTAPRSMTENECLAKVLEIFPDISHDHVRQLFRGGLDVGMLPDSTWCDQLIVRILDEGRYPTEHEAKRAALKRKREPSEDDFDRAPMESGHFAARRAYQHAATNALQNQYREIPVTFIQKTLKEQGSFYKAFLCLEEADRTYSATPTSSRPFRKVRIRGSKTLLPTLALDPNMTEAMESVRKETRAAKEKVEQEAAKRRQEEHKRLEEEQNAAQAHAIGDESQCATCYDQYPTNRMMLCNGATTHYLCEECARNCVHAELDFGRCRPKCCELDCGAGFSRSQLKAFLDPKVFDRLERLQQREDIREAGLENLESCPFCDFQAECVPVEIDREFRCQSDDCGMVSCRLCRKARHIPKSCDEAAKDRKGNVRHQVEEAMTEAVIRTCNACKTPFTKLEGCNKMACSQCGHLQCYVCSQTVKGYDHFHNSNGKCPLYDESVEKRHMEEAKAAEAKAREEVKQAYPDITDEELKIKMSELVHKDDKERAQAAADRRRAHFPQPAGDPIAIPGGGRRGLNALPLDPVMQPVVGAPPRLDPLGPFNDLYFDHEHNFDPVGAYRGRLYQQLANFGDPIANLNVARARVDRLNIHDQLGAINNDMRDGLGRPNRLDEIAVRHPREGPQPGRIFPRFDVPYQHPVLQNPFPEGRLRDRATQRERGHFAEDRMGPNGGALGRPAHQNPGQQNEENLGRQGHAEPIARLQQDHPAHLDDGHLNDVDRGRVRREPTTRYRDQRYADARARVQGLQRRPDEEPTRLGYGRVERAEHQQNE